MTIPTCDSFPAIKCNRDFSIYASVRSEVLGHVCRQHVWSIAQDDNIFCNTKDPFHLKAGWFVLITSTKLFPQGFVGLLLCRVTVKPPVAWPQGWEVLGRDWPCGTKEAGFNLTHTSLFCTSEVLCVHWPKRIQWKWCFLLQDEVVQGLCGH